MHAILSSSSGRNYLDELHVDFFCLLSIRGVTAPAMRSGLVETEYG